ncbi:MAG: VWA domain-containing protein [Candidatus Omnitrophota bacterium]|nr:VWA domain-containing protein [Candidatus Omnitrophota bacterium]
MYYANSSYFSAIFITLFMLIVFSIWAMNRRKARLERFADKELIKAIAPGLSAPRKIFKTFITITAIFMCLIALARPQWGFEWEEVKRSGLDILIAIDVSKSMLATDVKPNRLERSKYAVKDLIKKLNGDRIGLVAFAGTAFLQCPLTIDYNGFALALDDISISTIPRGGTSIAAAIKTAIDVFKGPEKKYKVLVIITDGEELEGDALRASKEASELGIMIYCIGVGTAEGELIPVIGERGDREYLADKAGRIVKTKINEDILKRIAISTGGGYVRATQSEFGLVLLYEKSVSKLEKRDLESKMKKRYQERFQNFLIAAILLLFIEPLISERRGPVL